MASQRDFDDNVRDELEDQTAVQPPEGSEDMLLRQVLNHPDFHALCNLVRHIPIGGSPRQRYLRTLWLNRFNAFYTRGLGKSVDTLPTGDDVVQFMVVFVRTITDEGKNGPLRYRMMWRGLTSLDDALTFTYKHWELTRHRELQIEGALCQLLDEGLLTT